MLVKEAPPGRPCMIPLRAGPKPGRTAAGGWLPAGEGGHARGPGLHEESVLGTLGWHYLVGYRVSSAVLHTDKVGQQASGPKPSFCERVSCTLPGQCPCFLQAPAPARTGFGAAPSTSRACPALPGRAPTLAACFRCAAGTLPVPAQSLLCIPALLGVPVLPVRALHFLYMPPLSCVCACVCVCARARFRYSAHLCFLCVPRSDACRCSALPVHVLHLRSWCVQVTSGV